MKRLLFGLVWLAGFAHPAVAQPCYFNRGYYAPPVVKVVEKQVAVATFVPLVVAVPAYGVGYPAAVAAPAAQAAVNDTSDAKLEAVLRRIEAALAGGTVQATQATAAATGTGPAILEARCAKCHTGASAKGEFPIFQHPGHLASLTRGDGARILLAAGESSMPPPPAGHQGANPNAVPDAELEALRQWVKGLPRK